MSGHASAGDTMNYAYEGKGGRSGRSGRDATFLQNELIVFENTGLFKSSGRLLIWQRIYQAETTETYLYFVKKK